MSEISDQTGRNSPCPCGSGRKFKNCHGRAGSSSTSTQLAFLAVIGLLALAVVIFAVSSGGSRDFQAPPGAPARVTDYASIPELETVDLSPARKAQLVRHYNHTPCPCDCDMTVAECRTIDPTCNHSKDLLTRELALEDPGQRPGTLPPLPAH